MAKLRGQAEIEFLAAIPPVEWDSHLGGMTPGARTDLMEGCAALMQQAALLRGYLDGRFLFGDGDHARGVAAGNKLREKVRRALGYVYPKDDLSF